MLVCTPNPFGIRNRLCQRSSASRIVSMNHCCTYDLCINAKAAHGRMSDAHTVLH
jgi:hypothetical protein